MKYSGAEIIIKMLEMHQIDTIAGIPGGANLPLYNALYSSKIRHILARHEQGAGFIAQGMARSTGNPAVCFATSGPGATNLITAIADAKLDSIPIIAITGQVPSALMGTDAFQEADTYGMTIPITKHNFLVHDASELIPTINKAFTIATEGRPGPVLIDVPKDVQTQIVEVEKFYTEEPAKSDTSVSTSIINQAAAMINASTKPVFYIGGGIMSSEAHREVIAIAEKNFIPVTSTLMGLGCIPYNHPLHIGMLGMHGARYTNHILEEADLLIALGVRFDDRATGNIAQFCPHAAVLHIDIDPAELNKIRMANLGIAGNVKDILRQIEPLVSINKRESWIDRVNQLRKEQPFNYPVEKNIFHPLNLIRTIGSLADDNAIITTDVGQHQMWTAQAYPFMQSRTFLTSGGLGTMGFGLPAAIGAALANPKRKVICFSGDGSILMNIQELATLAELNLNVTIVLLNNGHLGLVRQQQELFYDGNYIASKFDIQPDFAAIAIGFGIAGMDLGTSSDPYTTLQNTLESQRPCLINVPIDYKELVTPMVPPGKANIEMIG
ncbi:MAG TPA: biosynthetic-type acetolactate synthase large subunit [Bacteroidales bacterium]|nr:biosynthetic-type acetolactate synthase large subunit [Bacteroidales bacterium]